jgi:5-hydroxyisourate hydrolase
MSQAKSPLTTHILDTAAGTPASGVPVAVFFQGSDGWTCLHSAVTNDDGRVAGLLRPADFVPGIYRMHFDTAAYFAAQGTTGFYPYVDVVFEVTDPTSHHHVPLLLSPFGYSTYRGS